MFQNTFKVFFWGGTLLVLSFTQPTTSNFDYLIQTPVGFDSIPIPEDNQFTDARWLLGRKLFYDPILSKDSTKSCSSCHIPEYAFSDTVSLSLGVESKVGTRNAPTLTNVAYNTSFTRDGGVKTLEMQVLVPIQEHNEFDFNILLIADRMNISEQYVQMSMSAYNRKPDHYVITRALACFERTLISSNSRFDKYQFQGKKDCFTETEIKGLELFYSEKTNCAKCHNGFNFTNYSFQNNGLYVAYPDSGRKRLTNIEEDRALFKVPTLRNIALTAPYMHDGSLKSLNEVIEHYNNEGAKHRNKSKFIKPLKLTNAEKHQLESFLLTLTDSSFINKIELRIN